MTLAPVFRSGRLFEILEQEGIVERFGPARSRMQDGVLHIHADLENILGREFLDLDAEAVAKKLRDDPKAAAEFLQKYFFLILFSSVFEHIGIEPARLQFYAELSYCIMGTIAAADNLFDGEAKMFLPLTPVRGAVFGSVLQLMCFERLTARVGQRAIAAGAVAADQWAETQKRLLSTMALIGTLEGSEESGSDEILSPEVMVERVHGIRGGLLFSLVTVAPRLLENEATARKLDEVEMAVVKLGTAFQIVDDITDFEFDLSRRSHNMLAAEIFHRGSPEERRELERLLLNPPKAADASALDDLFLSSAQRVLDGARRTTRESLAALEGIGFWFPSRLADVVIQGIVADSGVGRMEQIAGS
jgi:hypothetical protein